VYDHEPEEVEIIGWEEFITRQWESIFVGYRSWTGLRTMGRRWSDLIEIGLSCSQDLADRLVQAQIIHGPDRGLESTRDARRVVASMVSVLADLRSELTEMAEFGQLEHQDWAALLEQHARLLGFVQDMAAHG
jgi:hypothetical protein